MTLHYIMRRLNAELKQLASVAFAASVLFVGNAFAISIGDHIQYQDTTGANLNIRTCAATTSACPVVDLAKNGDYGVIAGGPFSGSSQTWYLINWDARTAGYSASLGLVVISSDSNAFVTGNRVRLTTLEKNVRSCARTDCSIVKTMPVGSLGTIQSGPTSTSGFWWYSIRWDDGTIGYSSSGNLVATTEQPSTGSAGSTTGSGTTTTGTGNTGAGTGNTSSGSTFPDLSGVSLASNRVRIGETLRFSGNAVSQSGIANVLVYAQATANQGSILFESGNNVTSLDLSAGRFSFVATAPLLPSPGTYVLVMEVTGTNGSTIKKQFTVALDAAVQDTTPPVFTGLSVPAQSQLGKPFVVSGTVSDDSALWSVGMNVVDPAGLQGGAYFPSVQGQKSASLSGFSYTPTMTGTYVLRASAVDATGNRTNAAPISVNVFDGSARIKEIQALLQTNTAQLTTANSTLALANTRATNATTQLSSFNAALFNYNSSLNSVAQPSPTAPTTSSNKLGVPSGCVPPENKDLSLRSGLPLEKTSYQSVFVCFQHSKADVYFLSMYRPICTQTSCQPDTFTSEYPAGVLYLPKGTTPHAAIIQSVANRDQALYWMNFYKFALTDSFLAALAGVTVDASASSFGYPGDAALSEIADGYKVFRTNIRDYVEDSAYEIDPTLTEDDITTIKDVLSASLGSIPYVQEAKGIVEIASGQDILTGEPVSLWTAWAYILPAAKGAEKFASLQKAGRLGNAARVLGNDSDSALAFGKQLLSPEKRNLANRLGKIGEDSVRRDFGDAYIGIKLSPKDAIDMGGDIKRIPDGLSDTALSEIKNRKYVSCTAQLRDYASYAENKAKTKPSGEFPFRLFVRVGVKAILEKNPSFQKGGKCWPVTIIEHPMQ